MRNLETIAEITRRELEVKNSARERTLTESRLIIRNAANTIRAVHRGDFKEADRLILLGAQAINNTRNDLKEHPDIYWAGYLQDAQKEYAEARLTYALVHGDELPTPVELSVEVAPYLNGLGEAASELRRYILDIIRHGEVERGEEALQAMDDIYSYLVTVDFPDALTGGLRRTTDLVRSVLERTRGDLTFASRQQSLERALANFEGKLL